MRLTLVGYRGTGKTSVGKQLAERLSWEAFDLDPEIEQRAGKCITDIFAQDGEPRFRQLETEVLAEQLAKENVVILTGGGAVLSEQNRQLMKQAGPVIWLQATVETIQSRLQADSDTAARRPSLTGTDVYQEIADVLAARLPLYEDVSTIKIPTDGRTLTELVDEIVLKLSQKSDAI